MKVVTAEQMREIDRKAAESGLSTEVLMRNAGRAVAESTLEWLGGVAGKEALVLVGPGNNGGDGLVAAGHFQDAGAHVTLYIFGRRLEGDANFKAAQKRHIATVIAEQDSGLAQLSKLTSRADVVVDSLLGTGKAREIAGLLKGVLETVARSRRPGCRVAAVDLPTGLNADTGEVDEATIPAGLTVTLGYPKPGLFLPPGLGYAGRLVVADIGFPAEPEGRSELEMTTPALVKGMLPRRPAASHKGTFGKVLVIAGSINYIGAPCLAALGAGRVGAGLVTLACPVTILPIVASKLTEITFLPLPDSPPGVVRSDAVPALARQLPGYDTVLLGPGLGQLSVTIEFVESLLKWAGDRLAATGASARWVIDADGLNALAQISHWWEHLPGDTVLTPHPAELGRLLGADVATIQGDRIGFARTAAGRWRAVVVLKGANTVTSDWRGQTFINPSANPALATAGTGDVLSGAIAGLLAQGMEPKWAAVAGVFLHAKAGEMVRDSLGDAGALAGDLLPVLPLAISGVKA